jgi:hypothetical protein
MAIESLLGPNKEGLAFGGIRFHWIGNNAGEEAPFSIQTTRGLFEGIIDPVCVWGYNAGGSGTTLKQNIPAMYHSLEGRYRVNGEDFMEWNFEIVDSVGNIQRPLAFAIDRNNLHKDLSWIFRIGNVGKSFFRITNSDFSRTFLNVTVSGALEVNEQAGHVFGPGIADDQSLITFSSAAYPQLQIDDQTGNKLRIRIQQSQNIEFTALDFDGAPMPMFFNGPLVFAAPNHKPDDTDMHAGQIQIYLNEATNELKALVKYSDGSIKRGTISALA